MNKLSKRAVDKIMLFLNDKEFNCITLSRRELTILFKIYQSASSEIFELEEQLEQLQQENKHLKEQLDISNTNYDIIYDYFAKIGNLLDSDTCDDMLDKINSLQQENKQLKEKINCIEILKQSLPETTEFVILTKSDYDRQQKDLEIENIQLKLQLEQRDEVIDEAIEKCKLEIRASSYQYEKNHKQQELCYRVAHERILDILMKYRGDNNE